MADDGPSESFIRGIIRSVVTFEFILGIVPTPVRRLLKDPENFIREVLFNSVLAFVANLVFTTTTVIDTAINAVISPFVSVRVSLTDAIESAGEAVIGPVAVLNSTIATTIADALGVASFPLLVVVVVLEMALVVRAAQAAAPAVSDALGAIPVVGSLLDGVTTFLIRFVGGDPG